MNEDNNSGLGELLRRAREQRGLTLEQIANETKIPPRHLEALERDNFAAVPGDFYRRAETRAYARAVGLDENLALAQLESPLRPSEPTKDTPLISRRERPWLVGSISLARSARLGTQAAAQMPRTQQSRLYRNRLVIAIGVIVAAAVLGRALSERPPAPKHETDTVGEVPDLAPLAAPSQSEIDVSIEPAAARGLVPSDADTVSPETTEAPASADSVTQLVVRTQPAGARVTVEGIGWGSTPVTIRYLPPGDKRVRVSKDGYVTKERVLRLDEGRPRVLDIRLERAP